MNRRAITFFVTLALFAGGFFALPSSDAKTKNSSGKNITFTKDVAPIFFKNCAECHRAGEAAPFSVMSYKEVRPWAKSIREKVVNKEMPPWHADPHVGQFKNDRRLSQAEIDTITAWVDGGAAEGNPKDLPPAPKFAEGWSIGQPDLVLPMKEEYTVAASGPDEYQYFTISTGFTEDKYVQMAEARPGNRKVVHHILAFVIPPGGIDFGQMSREEVEKFFEKEMKNSPFYRDGFLSRMKPDQPVNDDGCNGKMPDDGDSGEFLTGYAPGHNPDIFEPGVAKKVPAGATLMLQVHYSKVAGSEQKDRSMVGFVFAKEPPKKLMHKRGVSNIFFKIPPGAERHQATACWTPKEDINVYSLMPHMHYRGAAMEFKAFYPDGKSEVLLNVPNYRFDWQTNYNLTQPKFIPKGTKIQVTSYFDNSGRNKFNPDPKQTVRFGDPTYDEMLIGYIDYIAERKPVAGLDAQALEAFVGRYNAGFINVNVVRNGDQLFAEMPNQPKIELLPEAENKFFVRETEGFVTFTRNDKGEVIEAVIEMGGRTIRAKKVKEATARGSGN
jgi:mono/diheme cytochrome c family protein